MIFSGSTHTVWGCGDRLASNSFYVGTFVFTGTSNPSSGTIISAPIYLVCRQIKLISSTISYMIASDSSDVSLLMADFSATTKKLTRYTFQSAFTTSSIQAAMFDPASTNAWFVGSSAGFGGGLGKTFTK